MWTPKQLLTDESVAALRIGGFSETEIEFLGWLSYTAAAINNSLNPVKAAHTIMAKESMEAMADKFAEKKKESTSAPKDVDPQASKARRKLRKLAVWQQEAEAEAIPKTRAATAGDDVAE
jgi:isoaspartyl peptidase/L-asparaginase-like protein (Ntn-hydrolase superfamily)